MHIVFRSLASANLMDRSSPNGASMRGKVKIDKSYFLVFCQTRIRSPFVTLCDQSCLRTLKFWLTLSSKFLPGDGDGFCFSFALTASEKPSREYNRG